jgi:small subunit ribosomal protein S1
MGDRPPKPESFAALFEGEASRAPRRRSFAPGDEMDVSVVQIGRDAVFVELDGKQEGFIEVKDVSQKTGELTVKVGSRIKARVAEVGGRPGAVRLVPLLVRPPEDDESAGEPFVPAGGVMASVPGGALVVGANSKGTVASVERYGVFVDLGSPGGKTSGKRGPRGLVPVAELGVPRGADLHRLFPVGTELETKIIGIDERGRIRLSVIALRADAERRDFEAFEERSRGGTGAPVTRGLGTLGDLLKKR